MGHRDMEGKRLLNDKFGIVIKQFVACLLHSLDNLPLMFIFKMGGTVGGLSLCIYANTLCIIFIHSCVRVFRVSVNLLTTSEPCGGVRNETTAHRHSSLT